jgi:DNA-binding transcriptional MerR regulator
LNKRLYHSNEFAKKSSVSVRTLQFYDKKGLLSPTEYTQAGFRLYSDDDLVKLQRILALKFLGFSLTEIKALIGEESDKFQTALRAQKAMMLDKRRQIDSIIKAIERIENMENDTMNYDAIVKVIGVIQMNLKPEWVSKYLTADERKTMRNLAKQSFSEDALKKLTKEEFTEEIHDQYSYFYEELRRLAAHNTDPASQEAQNLAQYLMDLNRRRSQGWDQEILAGMKKSWEHFHSLPEEKKPKIYALTTEERELIKQACAILSKRKIRDDPQR